MGPVSVGTDGAGSVRIPAAFCGNVGLKPSFGRVPAYPLSSFGTVSHLGPHTMSVRDAALMLNVLTRPDARDWTSLPYRGACDYTAGLDDGIRGLRVAWSPTLGYAKNVHPEVTAACAQAVHRLVELGAHVEAVDPGIEDPLEISVRPVVRRCLDVLEYTHVSAADVSPILISPPRPVSAPASARSRCSSSICGAERWARICANSWSASIC